jgi:hypothetical protein
MILASASSWRIITAGMSRSACRIFSNARWTNRSYVGLGGEQPDNPGGVPIWPSSR